MVLRVTAITFMVSANGEWGMTFASRTAGHLNQESGPNLTSEKWCGMAASSWCIVNECEVAQHTMGWGQIVSGNWVRTDAWINGVMLTIGHGSQLSYRQWPVWHSWCRCTQLRSDRSKGVQPASVTSEGTGFDLLWLRQVIRCSKTLRWLVFLGLLVTHFLSHPWS